MTIDVDLPAGLARFRLPEAVAARLQTFLDRQDSGQPLTGQQREEAEGLVNLASSSPCCGMSQTKTVAGWMAERGLSAAGLDRRVVEAVAASRYTPSPERRRRSG